MIYFFLGLCKLVSWRLLLMNHPFTRALLAHLSMSSREFGLSERKHFGRKQNTVADIRTCPIWTRWLKIKSDHMVACWGFSQYNPNQNMSWGLLTLNSLFHVFVFDCWHLLSGSRAHSLHSFIGSFIHSSVNAFVRSFVRLFVRRLILSFIPSLGVWYVYQGL